MLGVLTYCEVPLSIRCVCVWCVSLITMNVWFNSTVTFTIKSKNYARKLGFLLLGILLKQLCIAVHDAGAHALNYDKLQQLRLNEALRTILILHPTRSSPVIELCQNYGHIKNAISFRHNVKVRHICQC